MNEEEKVHQAIGGLVQRLGPYEWLLISSSNTVLSYEHDGDLLFAVGERKAARLLAEREREAAAPSMNRYIELESAWITAVNLYPDLADLIDLQ